MLDNRRQQNLDISILSNYAILYNRASTVPSSIMIIIIWTPHHVHICLLYVWRFFFTLFFILASPVLVQLRCESRTRWCATGDHFTQMWTTAVVQLQPFERMEAQRLSIYYVCEKSVLLLFLRECLLSDLYIGGSAYWTLGWSTAIIFHSWRSSNRPQLCSCKDEKWKKWNIETLRSNASTLRWICGCGIVALWYSTI